MPVDNAMYDRLGWWDDDTPLAGLRTGINPARFGYFRGVLVDRLGVDPKGLRALDIGCGGGLLAEEFARLGCRVTGVDPSEESIAAARDHARESGIDIEYRVAPGEELPFAEESFDIVYCCDVLEHVDDLGRVVAETARVLVPGGIYFYDTINRTRKSWLVMIKLAQEWHATSFTEPDLHDWDMFIRPPELHRMMERSGMANAEVVGLAPAGNPIALIGALRQRKRGEISHAEMGRRTKVKASRDAGVLYAGYGVKTAGALAPSSAA
ncbi:MAG: bifunctional 2-polyprenyl-6-hydroxyphenol methylase/3-demethylubiquinol 3-O-methyltransferase UbiG [Thermoleophilaceae bacterium]